MAGSAGAPHVLTVYVCKQHSWRSVGNNRCPGLPKDEAHYCGGIAYVPAAQLEQADKRLDETSTGAAKLAHSVAVLDAALRRIYRLPCQHPDDPDEYRKMALNLIRAQQIADEALNSYREATAGEGDS